MIREEGAAGGRLGMLYPLPDPELGNLAEGCTDDLFGRIAIPIPILLFV